MAHIEQSVADIFNDYLSEQSKAAGSKYHYFSLGGQDRDTGADYLVSNSNGFSLFEFKHSESQLKDEGAKERREKLCILLNLDKNKKMREIHDKCHFIAWMDNITGVVKCAPYRSEICNRCIFPECEKILNLAPLEKDRVIADDYCEQFISPPPERYANKKEFENYLAWLMKTASGSKKDTVELMTRSQTSCAVIRLDSVDAAYQWMQGVPGMNFKKQKIDSGYKI